MQTGQNLLDGDEHTAYLHADPRCADHVLDHPDLRRLIDLREPVAIMMLDTLLHVPDQDDPAILITPYTSAVSQGSYLGLSQFSQTQHMRDGLALFTQMYGEPPAIPLREPEQLAHLFTGLDLVEPGIVPVPLWHPDPTKTAPPTPNASASTPASPENHSQSTHTPQWPKISGNSHNFNGCERANAFGEHRP